MPLGRAVVQNPKGLEIVQEMGFRGEVGGDWRAYAVWLGKRYQARVWGEYFSNAMVLAIRVVLYIHESL